MKTILSRITLLFGILIFTGQLLPAQDILVMKNGDRKEVRIVEINDTQVKYYEYTDIDGLLFTMDRAKLREIIFEGGTKSREGENPYLDENYYIDDLRNNFKVNFTAFADATTILTFERGLNPYISLEVDLRVNGLGINNYYDESGIGVGIGFKGKLKPIFKGKEGYRPPHYLHGGYMRTKLGFSYSSFGDESYWYSENSYVHFGLEFGKQWVLANVISLDMYLGFHYYGGNFHKRPGYDFFNYTEISEGDIWGGDDTAGSAGIRVGVLF